MREPPGPQGWHARRAAYRILLEVGVARIHEHNRMLTRRLIDGALAAGLEIHTPLETHRRAGFVAIDFPGADKALPVLIGEGYKLDYRPNCGLRVGPHFYNTVEEVDRLLRRLSQLSERL